MRDIPSEISERLGVCGSSVCERVGFWSSFLVGRPYLVSPLGDGDGDTRLRFDSFDCMTFVETVLALSFSQKPNEIIENLDRIRYRGGKPDFHLRNHFVSADWIPANIDFLSPMNEFADSVISKEIDRIAFFERSGKPIPKNYPVDKNEKIELKYISKIKAKEVTGRISDCAIVLFVGGVEWTIISHIGILSKHFGKGVFRHASSRNGFVVEEVLDKYIESRPNLDGVAFLKIKDLRAETNQFENPC